MGAVRVIGVRHHSPACARLVARTIVRERPQAVLIEGPSDFNPRLPELLQDHELPIALYSYAHEGGRPARCWFPLLDYSPEWVALREGHAAGSVLRFIDLPHWHYRALPDAQRQTVGRMNSRPRYAEVVARLCRRFGCDGDDALWDHLFESVPDDAPPDDLAQRVELYFAELRGDEAGTEQDQARERHMSQWLAWAATAFESVLVVCGGWHKPALERALAIAAPVQPTEPEVPVPCREGAAGCYLVPFDYRQVDSLGGYGAGMPSPLYYQWVWQHGVRFAGDQALARMTSRLRRAKVALSTADLMALEQTSVSLARLRGHAEPLRVDLLDALQTAVVKEVLEAPAPWSGEQGLGTHHHPVLREALMALTGEGGGRLHQGTPLPPLVHDVRRRMAEQALEISPAPHKLVLNRRRPKDLPRSHLLWQLHCLGISSVRLAGTKAPHAARGLPRELNFEEHWHLERNERWYPDLIEAAVHGATLAEAARQCLLQRVAAGEGNVAVLMQCLMQAMRAGLLDMGDDFAQQLRRSISSSHDHGELAGAAQTLVDIAKAGFWGEDARQLFEGVLALLAERLLWLLEGRDGAGSLELLEDDVRAAGVFDALLGIDLPALDSAFACETLARLARSAAKPPGLRGAALGVSYQHGALGGDKRNACDEVLAITRAMPPRDALGDFLYGLFSCARALATEDDGIVRAIHAAIDNMGSEDFLVALPSLRAALGWFPPRERGALAAHVARLLGLEAGQQWQLTRGTAALLDARRIEARALSWAAEIGLLT